MEQTTQKTQDYWDLPVHEQPFKALLIAIPKRFIGLISKLIGVKMALFIVATLLMLKVPESFPWYAWIVVYIATLFGWEGLRWIEHIKK